MLKPKYEELNIEKIELDYENPRIAKALEIYNKDALTSEQISLALGAGIEDNKGPSYSGLKESIKIYGGIIHPIIVNKAENKYIVIEGNTRLQIYKEFKSKEIPGNWNTIRSMVYENLSEKGIHAIRLQSHLIGPRDWDPYSKAKYLDHLSNTEKLPISEIISFCGGNPNEIKKMMDAYNDMETHYRKICLNSDIEFDPRKFSAFKELQNKSILEALTRKYTKEDFARWVVNENIDKMAGVRSLPRIFKSMKAMDAFLLNNVSEAEKILAMEELSSSRGNNSLDNIPYESLAVQLIQRLDRIEHKEIKKLKDDIDYDDKKSILFRLYEALADTIRDISED